MKFTVPRDTLLHPLEQIIGAVERRQTDAILGNVLIEAVSDALNLTASDSNIELYSTVSTPVDVPGATTVPARKFYDICRSLPDSAVIEFLLEADKVKLKSGRNRFTLSTLNAAEFPHHKPFIEIDNRVALKESDLLHVLKRSSFAMALEDVRFYLKGIKLEVDGKNLSCIASDGHRLAYSSISIDSSISEPIDAIIPRKSVLELIRLLNDSEELVELSIEGNRVQIELPEVRMISKLVDGRFPDYNRAIPIDGDKELRVDKNLLNQSLGITSILIDDKFKGVRLSLAENKLAVDSSNNLHEQADDEIEAEYSSDPVQIGLNVVYLLDVLNVIDTENVRMRLKDGASSILVTNDDDSMHKYVIMPIRL